MRPSFWDLGCSSQIIFFASAFFYIDDRVGLLFYQIDTRQIYTQIYSQKIDRFTD